MLNLAFVLTPLSRSSGRDAPSVEAEGGIPGKLARWIRQQIRYNQALRELNQLDDRDLDDLNLARADFPALAWRHATGAAPLVREQG